MDLSQRARDDLAQLDDHISRLREQLSRAEEERRKLQIFLDLADRYGDEIRADEDSRRDSKSSRMRELAAAAIGEAGNGLTIHDLVAYVEAHGEDITGKDKTSYLSAVLSRDRRFSFSREKGWSVLRPLPRRELLESLERLKASGAPPTEAQENDA